MLTMTEAAGGYLNEVLCKSDAPTETAVRLLVAEDCLSAVIDEVRPGDKAYSHGGRKVLLLDETVSAVLATQVLDVRKTPEGAKLELR